MSCLVAVLAAFKRFVFGSRHDFLISDFSPFSQSHLSNQSFLLAKMAASYSSIFLLLFLDLGIRLQLGHGRGICIVDAFICLVIRNIEY